jgi:hypothetical protein
VEDLIEMRKRRCETMKKLRTKRRISTSRFRRDAVTEVEFQKSDGSSGESEFFVVFARQKAEVSSKRVNA